MLRSLSPCQLCLFCSCLSQALQCSACSIGHVMEPKRRPLNISLRCSTRLNSGHSVACLSHTGYQMPWNLREGNNKPGELRKKIWCCPSDVSLPHALYLHHKLFNPLINPGSGTTSQDHSHQGQSHSGRPDTHQGKAPTGCQVLCPRDFSQPRTLPSSNSITPFSHSNNSL